MKPVLHPHWESFPPQHPLIPYFFGVFLFILSFISLVGNTLILYVFLSTKSLRTPVSFKVDISVFWMIIEYLNILDEYVYCEFGPIGFFNDDHALPVSSF